MRLEKQLSFISRDALVYLAGIVDGEGCLYTFSKLSGKGVRYKTHRIIVTNTSKELVDWIANNFGGYIYAVKRAGGHRQAYQWILDGPRTLMLVSELLPYSIIKRAKALKMLNS